MRQRTLVNRTLLAILASLPIAHAATSQELDWDSVDWTGGVTTETYSNVGGGSRDVTVLVSGDLDLVFGTPDDTTSQTGGLMPAQESLQVFVDWSDNLSSVEIRFTFSAAIGDASFSIFDVDSSGTAVDEVTVTGLLGVNPPVIPMLTGSPSNSVIGNTATGTAAAGATTSDGNVDIQFSGDVDTIIIEWTSGLAPPGDPTSQTIAIHDIGATGLPVGLLRFEIED